MTKDKIEEAEPEEAKPEEPAEPIQEEKPQEPEETPEVPKEAPEKAPQTTPERVEAPLTSVSDIMIPLSIELCRKTMTLQQVGELQKNQIVEFAQMPTDPVDLVVNGKKIGQGELIDIEGKMGIKILSLSGA